MLSELSDETSNESGNEGKMNGKDAPVIESTIELSIRNKEAFRGACIDRSAQMTIICIGQASVYCKEHGGYIRKGK